VFIILNVIATSEEFAQAYDALPLWEEWDTDELAVLWIQNQMKKEMTVVLMTADCSAHVLRLWSTWRNAVIFCNTPLMSHSTLSNVCRCTLPVFLQRVPNNWTDMYLKNYKHLQQLHFLNIMTLHIVRL
jgi:hypothetical protein